MKHLSSRPCCLCPGARPLVCWGALIGLAGWLGGQTPNAQAAPDLAPLGLAVVGGSTLSGVAPNPRVQVSWGVTNQGSTAASGAWYDEIWYSTNGVLDANSVSLAFVYHNQTLDAANSYWTTNQVTLPLLGSANYWLFVQTDPQNYIVESNEANNTTPALPGAFTLTPPDLVAQNVGVVGGSTFSTTGPNPRVMMTWGVTNQGNGTALGTWYDGLWFSTNGVLDANSVNLAYVYHNQTLDAGASYRTTNQVTLPLLGSANYWLFVQTDPQNYVFESNKVNNVSAALAGAFTLTPPDLVPQNVGVVGGSAFSATVPNPKLMMVWGVTNEGNGTALGTWYDGLWFSTNGMLDANSVNLGYVYHNQTLGPGGSYSTTNQVTLPLLGSANYWLFVQTDPQNYVFESNKVNNVSAPVPGTFTLTPPDLVPQNVGVVGGSTFAATAPNPRVMMTWGVTNQGNGTALGTWYDGLWFSTNGVLDANSVNLAYVYHNQTLDAGASYRTTNQVTLPLLGSANYWLFVQTDPQTYVFESNKVNNVSAGLAGAFTLTPPDLVPSGLAIRGGSTIASTNPNPQVVLTWAVTNQGNGLASAPWYDQVWFSTNGMLDANSANLGYFYDNQSLAPGAAYSQTNSITLPLSTSSQFWLFVQTDPQNYVFESNKVNNVSAPLVGKFTFGSVAQPLLGIRLDAGQIELYWPTNFTGYHGQKVPAISGSLQWSNLVSSPVMVGQEFRLTDGPPAGKQFYRLSQ